jgi:KipI family sensor histidine kinase inhibitor
MVDAQAPPDLVFAGEHTLYAIYPDRIDPLVNALVLALFRGLRERAVPGIVELVPSYRALMISFDPTAIDDEALTRVVVDTAATTRPDAVERRTITLPVAYGGAHGPDLEAVAHHAGLSMDEVIERHAGTLYDVFFLGFTPGFPFLGGLEPAIATPRRATPRLRVAAGSVGIAGAQTGVYPVSSPGGWNIIGRTPVALFHPRQGLDDAVLLRPGDHIRFQPITPEAFDAHVARATPDSSKGEVAE